eukprot:Gregarina_sp_Pseudo_9__5502@NODE_710_length_2326_cov_387_331439_g669_i0_p1_GENE_NODE_710_length_2326_cov_387_331439_g669_i0NODE_710_length_2326_cov_387_331439_g669_i0_p1_ORF_typecomplete_len252_score49_63DUF4732/PF15876_5/0_15_NODE_710_length_2326_cov_387_331439_g669_i03321087
MLNILVAISAAVALTRAAPVYNDFKVTSEAAECQIEACKKAAGEVAIADIEACLDATPATCTFSMSFVNSGTTTKVCGTGLGFSVEELVPAVGTITAWTASHTPTATIDQGVTSEESCDIGIFAADSCEGEEQYLSAMTPTTQPFSLPLEVVNPPTALQAHTHIVFQLTATTPSDNCKKPITSVGFEDVALTLTVTGRATGNGDGSTEPGDSTKPGDGDSTKPGGSTQPEAAAANLVASLAFGVGFAWLMN